jgi:putative ABC transport system permease protein
LSLLAFIYDALRLALRSITERRSRALLTIVGIAIGPMALVAIISVVNGYSSYVLSNLQSLGQNLIIVTPAQDYRLTETDLNKIRMLEGVRMASPFYLIYGYVRMPSGEKRITIYATSVDLMFEAIRGIKLLEGRKPSPSEILGAVIGYNIAFDSDGSRAYSIGDPIIVKTYEAYGGRIVEKKVTLIVTGVVEKFGGALFLSPDDSLIVPTDAGKRVFGLDEWTGILVLAENSQYVPKLTIEIREMYGNLVEVMSFQGIARIVNSITGAMQFIALATSLAAFAVAVAGIAATMITSVMERYREIGVMKALGFTDGQVLVIIMTEALLMSLIGGVVGVSIGSLGAYMLSQRGFTLRGIYTTITIQASPEITLELILLTLGMSALVGVVGGSLPAYRAAKIPPAVALRYE